jgi:hypothetical protein
MKPKTTEDLIVLAILVAIPPSLWGIWYLWGVFIRYHAGC